MKTNTILVVEDDPRIQKALKRQFAAEGYDVFLLSSGPPVLSACMERAPVAVVLDLMLPGLSGREVCKQIKGEFPDIPVIILSAIADVADKVLLLETGADDYMTKPFSPRELLARVQAAVRRRARMVQALEAVSSHDQQNSSEDQALCVFGEITADFRRMEVRRGSSLVSLTAQEFKLLRHFLNNIESVITREDLLKDVWGYNFFQSTRIVDNQILKLRQKLERDPANPVHFRTVHGIGYKFVVDHKPL